MALSCAGPSPGFLVGNLPLIQAKGANYLQAELAQKHGPVFKVWGPLAPEASQSSEWHAHTWPNLHCQASCTSPLQLLVVGPVNDLLTV